MIDRVHRLLCVFLVFLILTSIVVPPVAALDPLGWLSSFFRDDSSEPLQNSTHIDTSDWPDARPILERTKPTLNEYIPPIDTFIHNASTQSLNGDGGSIFDVWLKYAQHDEVHTFSYTYYPGSYGTEGITVPLKILRSQSTPDGFLKYTLQLDPIYGDMGYWDAKINCHCQITKSDGSHAAKDIDHDSHVGISSQLRVHSVNITRTGNPNEWKLTFYIFNYGSTIWGFGNARYNITSLTYGYRNGVMSSWYPTSSTSLSITSLTSHSDTLAELTFVSDVDYGLYDYVLLPIFLGRSLNPSFNDYVTYVPPLPTPDTLTLLVDDSGVFQGQTVTFTPSLFNSDFPTVLSDDYAIKIIVNYPSGSQWGVFDAMSNTDCPVVMSGSHTGLYSVRAYCPSLDLYSNWSYVTVVSAPHDLNIDVDTSNPDIGHDVGIHTTIYGGGEYYSYPVHIDILDEHSALVTQFNVTSGGVVHLWEAPLIRGDYMIYARAQQTGLFDLTADPVEIHVGYPDRIELTSDVQYIDVGDTVSFIGNMYRGDSDPITRWSFDLYVDYPNGDPWYHQIVSPGSLVEVDFTNQAGVTSGEYTAYAVFEGVTSNDVIIYVGIEPPPPEGSLPRYEVPKNTPFTPIDRTNKSGVDTDTWLDGSYWAMVSNVDGILHDFVWGLGLPSPYQVYVWMRGSAGQFALDVSNKTREQLEYEAADDSQKNPLAFVVNGCQYVADHEHHYMQYILTLIRQNPYYLMQHDVSVVLTRIVPGFIWNVMAVFILLAGVGRILRFYIDYR